MSESLSPHEHEAKIHAFKMEMSMRLRELLFQPGVTMQEIARTLGAEEFVRIEKVGENKPPVVRFDVRGFVNSEIEKGTFLTLPESFVQEETVIIPPDKGEVLQPGIGEGGYEKPEIIPRSRYLAEVLTELHQPYRVVSGKNLKNMVRSLSYQIFIIPGIRKMVFVNDEQGNVTFVVHDVEEKQHRDFAGKSKDALRELEGAQVTSMRNVSDPELWKREVVAILNSERGEVPYEKVPEGWYTNKELAAILRVNRDTTERIIERLEVEHPEWVQTFQSKAKRLSRYCSPEMVVMVTTEIKSRIPPPEGWKHTHRLVEETGLSMSAIRRVVEQSRADHPDWIHFYQSENKKYIEHYHPDLVFLIRRLASERSEKAPEGWRSISSIAKQYGVDWETLARIAEKYRHEYKDQIKTFPVTGGFAEHFHPDIVKRIESEIGKKKEAPEGWYNFTAAAHDLKVDPITIRRFLHKKQVSKESHPEMFGDYMSKSNVVIEMISPALFDMLKKEFSAREEAPEGWLTNAGVARELEQLKEQGEDVITSRQYVKTTADMFRDAHPEWFKSYKTSAKLIFTEHYHPDLIAAIIKKLKRIK